MKRWLVGILLAALAGVLLVVAIDSKRDPIEKWEALGAKVKRNEQGEVVAVYLRPKTAHGDDVFSNAVMEIRRELGLGPPNFFSDAELVHLKGLTKIRTLSINSEHVTGPGLVHLQDLTSLKSLDLKNTGITDQSLHRLQGLQLTKLSIPESARTDLGLKHYLAVRVLKPNALLDLGEWKATDAGLAQLKGLGLTSLIIPEAAKTDLGLKHYLAALETHTALYLVGWKITDAGLVHLKGLTNLKKLWLEETKVSDAGLVHLKEMTSLEMLWLHGTQITDAGIAELRTALPDCKVTQKAF